MMTARYMVCKAELHMLWHLSTLIACSDCAHALMTLLTWSLIDSLLVTVTPRILSDVARCIPGNGGGVFT